MRRYALGFGVSAVLLVLVFRNTDWQNVWAAFRQAHRGLLGLSVVLTALGLWVRARRWAVLFWPLRDLDVSALLDSVNVGYLANNVLPARAGDVVRSYLASEWENVSLPHALSTTVFERLLDSVLLLLLFFGLFPFLPISPGAARLGVAIGAVLLVVLLGLTLVAWRQAEAEALLARGFALFPWLDSRRWASRLVELLTAFTIVRTPRVLAAVLAWSVVVWGNAVLVYWLILRAFALDVSPAVAALAIVAAALGLAAPSAPAGVGTFEGAVLGALLVVGIEGDVARSAVITLHAVNFVTLSLAGVLSLARRGMGYRDLAYRAAQATERVSG